MHKIYYMNKRLSAFLAAIILLIPYAKAQTDSLSISLLTCQPGKAIYELYGHTAIYVENYSTGTEAVYNYGLFDFNTPNFMLKFARGHTDYILGTSRIQYFLKEYYERGSKVFKQPLNLSQRELHILDSLLADNLKPKNRTYRYNFLYNNCATMALDKIDQSILGTVFYPLPDTTKTLRDLLTQHTAVRPWSQFAVDIILGSEIDHPLRYRQETFAPLCLMESASKALITDTAGNVRPLVVKTYAIADPDYGVDFGKPLFTPLQTALLLLAFIILVTLLGWYKDKRFRLVDDLLYGVQGIAGIIMAFMFFYSEHPAVNTNWLVIIFNPIPLLLLPFMLRSVRRVKPGMLIYYEFIVCTAFLVCTPLIPQYIEPAVLILIATFAVRALCTMIFCLHKHLHPTESTRSKGGRIPYLLFLMLILPATLQARSDQRPKLVVSIVVDQLDSDCLERMFPALGTDGLKRLWIDGYNRTNCTFDFEGADRASAVASIYTGASPFQHGIVASRWMNRKTSMAASLVDDGSQAGINTIERTSPQRLLATNLADELKLSSSGRAKVCSIAIERDAAVLAAGHEADLAVWLSPHDGRWASSAYYGNLPVWLEQKNDSSWHYSEWKPALQPLGAYVQIDQTDHLKSFSYTFRKDDDTWDYLSSPFANDRVTELALAAIKGMNLGTDDTPDLLALGYYAGNFRHTPSSLHTLEQQDIYVRLDRNISQLISEIGQKIGLDNVLFILTSTGYSENSATSLDGTRVPTGTVSMERTCALLNLYLGAKYGSGNYVDTWYRDQIYLNRDFIEDQNLTTHDVLESCIDLLVRLSGIRSVVVLRNLMSTVPDQETARRRNAYNNASTGDIIIETVPGWGITDENEGTTWYRKPADKPFPVILYGASIRSEINHDPISVSTLAPTLSYLLDIPTPNASTLPPLRNLQ